MIYAEKVLGRDNKDWIRVTFKPNPYFQEAIQSVGAIYVPHANAWALPFEKRNLFERTLGNFLIIWKDEEVDGNGGIDEENYSKFPEVDGYGVTYNEAGEVIGSEGFKTAPWGEFQVRGFNALVKEDFLILADDPGLGKTWQVATAMEARKKMGQLSRGLVIVKASLLFNWRNEIHMHTNEKAIVVNGSNKQRWKLYAELMNDTSWTFLIISYETFRADAANLNVMDNTLPLDFCILDEAHKIKNPMSKLGMAMHVIPSFRFRYVLTATPLPNSPLESYNYLRFGRHMGMNYFEFEDKYSVKGGYGGKEIIAYKNILELKERLQSHMLRRRKKDKLKDLPDITFKTIPVEMTPRQVRMYRAVKEEIIEDLKDSDLTRVPNVLAKLLRLQQVTDSLDIIGVEPSSENSAKLNTLDDILDELIGESGQKVIIFSRFRTMVEIMEERYAKYHPAVIHGDIDSSGRTERSALRKMAQDGHNLSELSEKQINDLLERYMSSERQKAVERFQRDPDCKVFLGCAPACREGLTLTAATHVLFVDCEWSPAYVEQAFSRAHRIGQKGAVTVWYLVCTGTIDEKVQTILANKEGMAQEMIDNGITEVNATRAKDVIKQIVGVDAA
jgi:SNF2 family DNA or RNA helicase